MTGFIEGLERLDYQMAVCLSSLMKTLICSFYTNTFRIPTLCTRGGLVLQPCSTQAPIGGHKNVLVYDLQAALPNSQLLTYLPGNIT